MKSSLRTLLPFLVAIFISGQLFAAQIDTVETFSTAMNKKIKAVVVIPDSYQKNKNDRYPVVYLLHGAGGNYASFAKGMPELKGYADKYNVLMVCTDANLDSWYFDSPIDPACKYETYVSGELVQWTDKNYRTIASRSGRGITGYSMGGHGAMYLAFKHQDIFGTAGSMSGGVDFRPFPKNWNIAKRLGSYAEFPERWDQNTVINLIGLVKPGALALIVDCGTGDFFFDVNNQFHAKLLENKIAHDYVIRPGKHDMPYWRNALDYQLLFMSRFFKGN